MDVDDDAGPYLLDIARRSFCETTEAMHKLLR
jgi:hypothetical protein